MQLETQALLLLLGKVFAVAPVRPLHRQLGQVVGLELDAVELVVAAQFLDLLAPLLFGEDDVVVLVARELVVEVLLGEPRAVFGLGAELLGDLERRHDRRMVDRVALDLVADIDRRPHRLGIRLAEDRGHLGRRLQPLLLGVEHALRVVEVLARREADQPVVGLGVVLVHEVYVVGADHAHTVFGRQLAQVLVHLELHGVGLVVGPLDGRLVQLELEVIVVAEDPLVPADRLFGPLHVVGRDGAGHLAGQAGRTADQPLVVFLNLGAVGTRAHVEALGPRLRDDLDQVVVSLEVLGQQDQVVAALVGLALLVLQAAARHVDLTADDRLEGHLAAQVIHLSLAGRDLGLGIGCLFRSVAQGGKTLLALGGLVLVLALDLLDVVVELLDSEHVAVVGDGDARLPVGHGLVHQTLDAGLTVEDRVLRVYVKVYELGHAGIGCFIVVKRHPAALGPPGTGPDKQGQRYSLFR